MNPPAKIRNDLIYIAGDERTGQRDWIVKDPISFQHFLFSETEYFLLQQFDGIRTLENVVTRWREHFQTQSLTEHQLENFANRLILDNLLIIDQLGDGERLFQQSRRLSRSKSCWWANPLAIRFRGFNVAYILRSLEPIGGLIFHPRFMTIAMLVTAILLGFLFGHVESLAERVPSMQQLLNRRGIVSLAITAGVIKLLHELGHGLALRRFGGECFEIGVMLLVGIPTLYCNVSDAWAIPERWKRMVVSFAGIYVEILVAGVAAVAWFWTPPSLLNAILFNIVLLCSINTLLINGNPLLRYDGYYLLTDWLRNPNLSGAASHAVNQFIKRGFCKPTSTLQPSFWLLGFGIASLIYRWLMTAAILSGIILVIGESGSYPIGYCIAGGLLLSMTGNWIQKAIAMAKSPRHRPADLANKPANTPGRIANSFSWQRSLFSFSIVTVAVYFIGWVPLPQHVYCRAELSAVNPVRVYAASAGKLLSIVSSNQIVDAGAIIGQLENSDLKRKLKIKQNELIQGRAQLLQLKRRVNEQPNLVAQIEEMKNRIKSLIDESLVIDHEVTQLQILAPISGMVIPADARPLRMVHDLTRMRRDGLGNGLWEGTLSEGKNRGCYVPRSEHLLTIVNPAENLILLTVGESEMDSVERGQHVRVRFELAPDSMIEGIVVKILRQETAVLGDPNDAHSDRDALGQLRPMESNYRIEVGDAAVPNKVLIGSTGYAKIEVRPATIFLRLKRLIQWSLETRTL